MSPNMDAAVLGLLAFICAVLAGVARDRFHRRCAVIVGWLTAAGSAALMVFAPNAVTLHAATNSVNWRQERSIGIGQVISNPTNPLGTSFTVPPGTRHAWISVWTNPACWTMDGETAPTASSGGKWPAGTVIKLENSDTGNYSELKKFKFINCAEGATEVRMMPTRDQRPSDP